MERRVLSPYLSALHSKLQQVKWFEIWQVRSGGMGYLTGTLPVKDKELLGLVGGRARETDCQAGHVVVSRCVNGRPSGYRIR